MTAKFLLLFVVTLCVTQDIFYMPYKCAKKNNNTAIGAFQGFVTGIRNTVESPFMIVKDVLCGTKKIVKGVFNTPEATMMFYHGMRFNSWMGWSAAHKISKLTHFPGRAGDMLCVQNGMYSHTMIKVDDNTVVHRTGTSQVRGADISQCAIADVNVHAGITRSSLEDLQSDYETQSITVVDADYCIVVEDKQYLVFKKREERDIMETIDNCLNDDEQSNGWALYSKNCEHFCFWVRYGVDTSIQINKIFSLNQ